MALTAPEPMAVIMSLSKGYAAHTLYEPPGKDGKIQRAGFLIR